MNEHVQHKGILIADAAQHYRIWLKAHPAMRPSYHVPFYGINNSAPIGLEFKHEGDTFKAVMWTHNGIDVFQEVLLETAAPKADDNLGIHAELKPFIAELETLLAKRGLDLFGDPLADSKAA